MHLLQAAKTVRYLLQQRKPCATVARSPIIGQGEFVYEKVFL